MTAYFFFDVKAINDQELITKYRSQVIETVEAFGGRYLIMGGDVENREGSWKPTIPVLIQFPDIDKARAWYSSNMYAPLLKMRLQAMDCDAVLLQGFDHPLSS